MKKVMYAALIASAVAVGAYAACMGPFCYDDTGATVAGLRVDGNGMGMPSASSTTINGISPKVVGQEIVCTTCVNAGTNRYGVCVDTAANSGGWVMISSTTQACQ